MQPVVQVENLRKVYELGSQQVVGIDGVDLRIDQGEFVAVMGPSGSGKSTFMHIAGLLDEPTDGRYFFEGSDVSHLSDDERADIRSRRIGFVFQSYNLLSRTTALENVELPMLYAGVPDAQRRAIALEKMDVVGVAHLADHAPNQMSGGQQQRVAIARSLVNDPGLILADEPTGALDTKTSEEVMQLFMRLNEEHGITILLVTHEPDVAAYAKRVVTFRDGKIQSDSLQEKNRSVVTERFDTAYAATGGARFAGGAEARPECLLKLISMSPLEMADMMRS
jgi:putative ABC transport system ATP-binding protein